MKPARTPRGSGHTVALVPNLLTVRGAAAVGTWPQGGGGFQAVLPTATWCLADRLLPEPSSSSWEVATPSFHFLKP